MKTCGDLRRDYNNFLKTEQNKKLAKECNSVINAPLFDENDDTCVIEKCVIPELHITMGFTNHLFWKGIVPIVGREKALIWPTKLSLISKNYQGEIFEGNACRNLLKEADRLNDPDIYQNIGTFELVPFISAFKAMDKLVHTCFSLKNDISLEVLLLRYLNH